MQRASIGGEASWLVLSRPGLQKSENLHSTSRVVVGCGTSAVITADIHIASHEWHEPAQQLLAQRFLAGLLGQSGCRTGRVAAAQPMVLCPSLEHHAA